MKRLIFTILPLAASLFVAAQTDEADSTVVTQTSSSSNDAKDVNFKIIGNNRNIFQFNGQNATPSGHEAMSMGSGYSFFKKAVEKRLTTGDEANSGIFIRDNSIIKDNTNIFMLNGQTATPSGHEATSINGGYASFGRKNPWNVSKNAGEVNENTEKDPANNIIIYKKNGQAATKTGHEATGMGSGYSFSKKDK